MVPLELRVVADGDDVGEILGALSEPLPTAVTSRVDGLSTGGGACPSPCGPLDGIPQAGWG